MISILCFTNKKGTNWQRWKNKNVGIRNKMQAYLDILYFADDKTKLIGLKRV